MTRTTAMDNIGQYKCGVQKCHSVAPVLRDTLLSMYKMLGPISDTPSCPPREAEPGTSWGLLKSPTALAVNRKHFHIHDSVIVQTYLKGNGNQAFTGPVAQFLLFQNIMKVYLFSIVLSDRSFWHKYLEALFMQAFKTLLLLEYSRGPDRFISSTYAFFLSFSVHLPFPCSVKHINFFILKGIYFQLFQEMDPKLHSYII